MTAPRMTTLTLGKMNERSPPSHGRGVMGLPKRKLDANHSPNAHKENMLTPDFREGVEKTHTSHTK
jgi:hypothetical protein